MDLKDNYENTLDGQENKLRNFSRDEWAEKNAKLIRNVLRYNSFTLTFFKARCWNIIAKEKLELSCLVVWETLWTSNLMLAWRKQRSIGRSIRYFSVENKNKTNKTTDELYRQNKINRKLIEIFPIVNKTKHLRKR